MKLLVTGGAGFIGSNFIRYWISEYPKDKVLNLDKLTYAGNLTSLRSVEDLSNYKFIKGDICNAKLVDQLMSGVDVVVHFAAESHVDRSIEDPTSFILTNVLGTQVLLDAALKYKVARFHHVSTDEVFGSLRLGSTNKFSEESSYDPRSPYSASKAASDHLVRAYFHTYGLPVTITNCSNNFGPFANPEKFIPLVITNLLEGKKVPVYGDGENVRDWLYVLDHCRAICLVLKKGEVGETYCVGGMEKDVSNLTVVKRICKMMRENFSDSIEFVGDRPGHDRRYAVDWGKIKQELGWKPVYDFDEALEKTIDWYRENEDWWKNLKNSD